MKNRTHLKSMKFTLVELLIVISIIALLAALLFPAIGAVRDHAKKVKARAAATAIKLAITQYEAQYGLLPISSTDVTTSGTVEKLKTDKYAELIAILSQVDYPAVGSNTAATVASQGTSNSRKTRFLSVTSKYADDGYVDPWGNEYIIGIDSNYDGIVKGVVDVNGDGDTTDDPGDCLNGKVFIYSWGKDKDDNDGDKEDDVITWE